MSNAKCQLNRYCEFSVDIVRSQWILWDPRRFQTMLHYDQSMYIKLAHRLYTHVRYFHIILSQSSFICLSSNKISAPFSKNCQKMRHTSELQDIQTQNLPLILDEKFWQFSFEKLLFMERYIKIYKTDPDFCFFWYQVDFTWNWP